MNKKLHNLYSSHWNDFASRVGRYRLEWHLSQPHLIDLPETWAKVHPKLMIVGQQTNGWGERIGNYLEGDPVASLMSEHAAFEQGRFYRPTPFWQASWLIHMNLTACVAPFGFAWTNLVKLDQNGCRPSPCIEDLVCSNLPVVAREIAIAAPDIIVFFTGPNYDRRLQLTWAGATLEPVYVEQNRTEIARVEHNELPRRSFRVYHPSNLARDRNRYERVMRQLSQFIASEARE